MLRLLLTALLIISLASSVIPLQRPSIQPPSSAAAASAAQQKPAPTKQLLCPFRQETCPLTDTCCGLAIPQKHGCCPLAQVRNSRLETCCSSKGIHLCSLDKVNGREQTHRCTGWICTCLPESFCLLSTLVRRYFGVPKYFMYTSSGQSHLTASLLTMCLNTYINVLVTASNFTNASIIEGYDFNHNFIKFETSFVCFLITMSNNVLIFCQHRFLPN